MSAFAPDAELDQDEFVRRHGGAFLLRLATPEGEVPDVTTGKSWSTLDVVQLAFAVHCGADGFARIGRGDENEIVIPHRSVSRLHARIHLEAGLYVLQDAGSRNGTQVRGMSLAKRGEGSFIPLTTGDTLRFGSVDTLFVDVPTLMQMARVLASLA